MKALLLAGLFFSGLASAQALKVQVSGFNFTYNDPHGEGTAAAFSRSGFVNEPVQVMVDKVDKNFHLTTTGAENQEFVFKDAPSFMTEAETISVTGFNLTLAEKLTMTLGAGRFNSKASALKLDNVTLDCNRDPAQTEAMDQLLVGCVQRMAFKAGKFSSQEANEVLLEALQSTLESLLSERTDVTVNSLDLRTSAGKYDLSADVKAQVSGKVKSYGSMSYDAAAGKLTLKISEVKFSILNITGKVFEELKKKESANLQVREPYVYYRLK